MSRKSQPFLFSLWDKVKYIIIKRALRREITRAMMEKACQRETVKVSTTGTTSPGKSQEEVAAKAVLCTRRGSDEGQETGHHERRGHSRPQPRITQQHKLTRHQGTKRPGPWTYVSPSFYRRWIRVAQWHVQRYGGRTVANLWLRALFFSLQDNIIVPGNIFK